jgi:uncharacterized protein (DUF362 family)
MVALTRCNSYSADEAGKAIAAQFELLGGLGKFVKAGDTVLLKPNFIAAKPRYCATQTDPAIILETARLLKDFGAKPILGDSPAWGNVYCCVKKLELEEPLRKLGVPVMQLNKPRKCVIDSDGTKVGISAIALDSDVVINLPKLKTHQQLVATFAVKNMFGTVSGKRKAVWHFAKGKHAEDFCRLLIEIYKFVKPALTIIDAVMVMDGAGPIRGRARPLGWIIGGTDPIALEVVCCKLVNLTAENLPIVETARKIGFGCSDFDRIKIVGDPLPQKPCTDFELPRLIPIRFSLPHVCRSIVKQIILLAKSRRARSTDFS